MLLDYSAIEDESHAYYFDDEDDMYRSQANFCPTTGSYNIAQQQAQYPGSDFYYTEPRTSHQEQLMSTSTWTPTSSSARGMTDWQGQVTMGSYINPMDQQTNSMAQYSESDNYSGLCAVAQAINRTPTMSYHHQWMRSSTYRFNPSTGKTRTKDKYRVVYTDHQRLELEKEFRFSRYITIRRKSELASSLGLSERQVKIWFQNRRAKDRKQAKKQGVQLDETEGPTQTNQRTGFIEGVAGYSNQKELLRNHPASYRMTDQSATVLIKEEPISSQSQTSCLKSL